MESTRVIMLKNWHFDILNYNHWMEAWDLWLNSWVISEPKEWAFVLIIISFIPLWFTGWIALSLISWFKLAKFILTLPWRIFKTVFYKPARIIGASAGISGVKRKKSYKEIRPRALRAPFNDRVEPISPSPISIPSISPINIPSAISSRGPAGKRGAAASATQPAKEFDHSLFKFDDSFDDLDFDIDSFEFNQEKPSPKAKPAPKNKEYAVEAEESSYKDEKPRPSERESREKNKERDRNKERDNRSRDNQDRDSRAKDNQDRDIRAKEKPERDISFNKDKRETKPTVNDSSSTNRSATGSCADIIKQKGYEVLSRIAVKNTIIDYVGVSNGKICLCLLDREPGDWLADEERFNDEEPLWFSENSHRISPIRKIDLAKGIMLDRLAAAEMNFEIEAYVVVQIGNIINAEDMFDVWNDMNINVTRIDRGTPKEIKLFARALVEADKPINASKLDKIMKIIKDN